MIALYIIIGILGGAALVGLVVVVFIFFRELKYLRTSLDQTALVLRTLSKDNTLAESLKAFSAIVATGESLMKKMDVLNETVQLFYKVAIQSKPAVEQAASTQRPAQPSDTDSAIYSSDEETMAQHEQQKKLRHSGIKAEPAEVEIDSGKAVKAGDV